MKKWDATIRVEPGEPAKGGRRLVALVEVGSGKPETIGVQRDKVYQSLPAQSRVPFGTARIELVTKKQVLQN